MKHFFSLCSSVVFSVIFFCTPTPSFSQSGSSVWIINKNGNTMFLGGSIHVLRDEDFPLPEEFDRAFAQSSMMVLEADIERMSDPTIAQYLMTRMFLPTGKTLDTVLDSKTYEMLKAKCEEFGFPIEIISGLKPSMVVTMLSMLEIQNHGFVQQGVDSYYLAKAKETGKSIGFLETVEAQIDMIVTMGDGYEDDFVKYSLYDMDNTENELASIVSEWRTGDAGRTERSLTEMKNQWPVLYQTMVVDRNEAWLPQLEEYLAGGKPVFVIAGLAHMHGPDGLLCWLENSGCTVEQLR